MRTNFEKEIIMNTPAEKVWETFTKQGRNETMYFDMPDFNLEDTATFNFY